MSFYGLIIGIAFAIGIEFFSNRNKIIPKKQENRFLLSLFFISLLGARFYSVFSDWNYYLNSPLQILNTRAGGLGIYGGLLAGAIFIYIYSIIHKLSFLNIINTIAPIVPLGQSIGRWGNYVNKEVFGIPTYANFGQFISSNHRPTQFISYNYFHPVWLYESVLDFFLFLFLLRKKNNQAAIYFIGYGIIRFILEFLRWDTWQIYSIKIGQVIGIIFVIFGTILLKFNSNENKENNKK